MGTLRVAAAMPRACRRITAIGYMMGLRRARAPFQPRGTHSGLSSCSARTAKANKRVRFGYALNYLIDIEWAVIVDLQATPTRTYDEVVAAKTMIARTEQALDLKPDRLAADTAYGTGKFLGWLVGHD